MVATINRVLGQWANVLSIGLVIALCYLIGFDGWNDSQASSFGLVAKTNEPYIPAIAVDGPQRELSLIQRDVLDEKLSGTQENKAKNKLMAKNCKMKKKKNKLKKKKT